MNPTKTLTCVLKLGNVSLILGIESFEAETLSNDIANINGKYMNNNIDGTSSD